MSFFIERWRQRETIESLADDCRRLITRHTSENEPSYPIKVDPKRFSGLSQLTAFRGQQRGLGLDRLDRFSLLFPKGKNGPTTKTIVFPNGSQPFVRIEHQQGLNDRPARKKDLRPVTKIFSLMQEE